MTSRKTCWLNGRRCLLVTALLIFIILLISLQQLEHHLFDATALDQHAGPAVIHLQQPAQPAPVARSPNNTAKPSSASSHSTYNLDSLSDLKPYRTHVHKIEAFRRYLSGNGKIIVIHQRKSGGTTLDGWMRVINKKLQTNWDNSHAATHRWNSTVETREAYHFFHKIAENNITWSFLADPYAVYVTSLRHPIDRILSQYEFEWRWSCQRCNYQNDMERYKLANMTDWSFMARADKADDETIQRREYKTRKYASLDFNDWLQRLITFEIDNPEIGTNGHSMQSVRAMYVNNYFLWIACCKNRWCNIQKDYMKEASQGNARIKGCVDKAVRVLKSFDIVLITEWMNDLRSQVYVNQLFFEGDDAHIESDKYVGMAEVNKPYPHHVLDRGKNYMISPENEEMLYRLNNWDLKIYQIAKSMVFHRMETVWDPLLDEPLGEDKFNRLLYNKSFEEILRVDDDMNDTFVPYKEMRY